MYVVIMTESVAAAVPTPVIEPCEGIDDALVEIGRRYWSLDGFDSESGRPLWSETTGNIDCSPWGTRKAYVVAAAAVRTVLPGYSCPRCSGELVLTSRTALDKIASGEQPAVCADCDESLQEHVARVLNPKQLSKAREQHDQRARHQRGQQLRHEWDNQRHAIVRDTYEVTWLPDHPIPSASVRVELIVLALLDYAPSPAPLGPVREWVAPLHPNPAKQGECVAEALRADLIRIHPASHVDSLEWEPATFDKALGQVDTDGQVPPPVLTNRYYALAATHFTPYGHSLGTAATAVRDHLAACLDPAAMTKSRQLQLLDVTAEVLAEEAIRYFQYQLAEHHLPEVPDNHRDRLVEALYAAARVRPLSELYNLAWRSVRDAATAAQRNPQAPKANMTTHGVNRFESNAQEALNPKFNIKPFGPVARLKLAAVTRTLFLRVLQQNSFTTSVPDIEATLPAPIAEEPEPGTPPLGAASTESDFGQLSCTVCGFPVQPQDAWLWVEVREAFDYLEDTSHAMDSGDLLRACVELQPARWQLGHTECDADSGAVCETRLPTTYPALLAWAATILRERRKWIHGSDFATLLSEAAQRTDRFSETRTP